MRTQTSTARFDFRRPCVEIVHDQRSIEVPVLVSHDMVVADTTFLDFGPAYDRGPVVHRLDVYPDLSVEDYPQELRSVLGSIESPRQGKWARGPRAPESVPLLATLEVMEHPDSIRRQVGRSWFWWMDAHEGSTGGGALLSVIEGLTRNDDHLILKGSGSAYVYRELHVHPRVGGQGLGTRLLAHALASLPRSDTDASMLIAYPIPSIWAPTEESGDFPPAATEQEVMRLVRTYKRVGFRVWPSRKRTGSSPRAMYVRHDYPLPFLAEKFGTRR